MNGINLGKVIVGGVVAGLVLNIGQSIVHLYLFAAQSAAITEAMGLPETTGSQIGMYWALGFVIGLVMMFMYAGFRPRCGPGVNTALAAGAVTFILGELIPTLYNLVSGLTSLGDSLPFVLSTLVLLMVSSVAGAALYTEDDGGGTEAA
jgi:TRAP-type C4-dicarboxylate transport system permease large subunit